jgi:hypothetical protein
MEKTENGYNRRTFLALATSPLIASLYACRDSKGKNSLPDERDRGECESIINWTPDIAHPVSWGVQSFEKEYGAPADMLIYYPSCHIQHQTRRQSETGIHTVTGNNPAPVYPAPMLKLNAFRWPVVLLLHGNMPPAASHPASYRMWWRLASTLARCGYVVVVPSHDSTFTIPTENAVINLVPILNWVRTNWSESEWVAKLPRYTAIAGHSNGALLAAAFVAKYADTGAFVSLGGNHAAPPDNIVTLTKIKVPSFYMWTKTNPAEDLDNGIWNSLTVPKYAGVYQGTHFDYLEPADTGTLLRGACPHIPAAAADLVTLFIASQLQLNTLTGIEVDLKKPQAQLTSEQSFYAGGHLSSFDEINNHIGCNINLQWNISGVNGSRIIGPL